MKITVLLLSLFLVSCSSISKISESCDPGATIEKNKDDKIDISSIIGSISCNF